MKINHKQRTSSAKRTAAKAKAIFHDNRYLKFSKKKIQKISKVTKNSSNYEKFWFI